MLTIQPCSNQLLNLVDRGGQILGKIKVHDIRDDLVSGQFHPEPNYKRIQHLFVEYENAVSQMIFSILDELEEAIEALGLHLRSAEEKGELNLYDVQIMNETAISFKLKEVAEEVDENLQVL